MAASDSGSSGGFSIRRLIPRLFSDAFQRRDPAAIADWFATCFLWVGLFGLVAAGLAAGVDQGTALGLRVFGLGLLFAGASAIGGWVLGLLFGIPRSVARGQRTVPAGGAPPPPQSGGAPLAPPSDTTRSSTNNTNLEDISDWLTKTLVGVGLTQLYTVPHGLWRYAQQLNQFGFQWFPEKCTGNCAGPGQLLALALFMFFAPGGFWLGYIGTRTFLTMWLDAIDRWQFGAREVAMSADPSRLQLDPSGERFVPASGSLLSSDESFLKAPLSELTRPAEIAAWAAAQARVGNLQAASQGLQKALNLTPSDPTVREQLAKVYLAQSRPSEAGRLIGESVTPLAVLQALYEGKPSGFRRAIEIGRQLLQRPESQNDSNLHTWLAAAYGQEYGYEKSQNNSTRLDEIRANVIRHVEEALRIDPRVKAFLYSLWKPAQGSTEDDLSSLPADDKDLQRLLGPAAPTEPSPGP